jgi:hypothetical protein
MSMLEDRGRSVALTVKQLEQLGVRQSPETIEQMLLDAIRRAVTDQPSADPRHDLSSPEVAALERGGINLEALETDTNEPFLRTAAEYTALLATGLTVGQVASMLRVQPSRVRQRLAARTLYGLRGRRGWSLPRFQFGDESLISGLERVLPRISPDVHPVALFHWFTSPNVDLVLGEGERPVSPRDWLRMGNDPAIVADLAAEL